MKKRVSARSILLSKFVAFAVVMDGLGLRLHSSYQARLGVERDHQARILRAQEKRQRRLNRNRLWYWHLCRVDA